jgi:DNA-binding transcriptional ArsR family regulator
MARPEDRHRALALALRHELRRKILRLMYDGRESSPREIAKELDESLSKVSYHVRVLAKCGALAPARQEQIRGATKHFYRRVLEAGWAKKMLDETKDE